MRFLTILISQALARLVNLGQVSASESAFRFQIDKDFMEGGCQNKSFETSYLSLLRSYTVACVHLPDRVPYGGAAGGGQAGCQDSLRLLAGAHLSEEIQIQVRKYRSKKCSFYV